MLLAPGARLGSYEIIDPLGAGGMGEVYRAYDAKLHRSVAIKVLNPASIANAAAVRRLEQEARTASGLNHPGIVTIHETGESDGQFYIVMELVDGVTLRHQLRRGPRPLKKALQIASELADALAKAHEAGVVHRDLKPENVMVTSDDHVKIVDFGLAKLMDRPAPVGPAQGADTESGRGALVGTVGYMAPEQVRGESTDYRADQFAFGAILYELVTGNRAFQRSTAVETLSMILNEEPVQLASTTVPLPLIWSIERCLAKDAKDRYAATRDLAQDIRTLRDYSSELTAVNSPRPGTRRTTIVAAAALVAALLIVSALALWSRDASPGAAPAAPTFTQLTFGHGHVANARFAPDGQTVFYAASWGGAPVQVFEWRPTGPESRRLEPASASLASVSSTGELALLLRCRLDWGSCVGTLASMPQAGDTPREILENVVSADWAPDGKALAAIQVIGGEYQLQFPPETPLYKSANKIGFLRFSPQGDRLAFVEYRLLSDEEGVLKVIDLRGRVTPVSTVWEEIRDIAWSPSGDEIWLSASQRGRSTSIHAVSLSGTSRLVLRAPGAIYLHDLANGRALVANGLARAHMIWTSGDAQRDVSWLDWSTVADLSPDGQSILFYEWGHAVNTRPGVYLRRADASDAVRLGEGTALALSPDGRWAVALRDAPKPHLVLLPTGAGTSRELPLGGLTDIYWARWFPDGERLLVVGDGPATGPGSYVQRLDTGRLERIGEKGMLAVLVSRDGRRVLLNDPLQGYLVWPLDGGRPQTLKVLDPGQRPIQWSEDGKFLYVRDDEESVVRLHRLNIVTGKSELLKELAPRDPAGVVGVSVGRGELAVTPDGKSFVFTYWTFLRDLFLVEGLSR
jgi:dipeptidyl aminopeptidase/acylaminoacyl peptidase